MGGRRGEREEGEGEEGEREEGEREVGKGYSRRALLVEEGFPQGDLGALDFDDVVLRDAELLLGDLLVRHGDRHGA